MSTSWFRTHQNGKKSLTTLTYIIWRKMLTFSNSRKIAYGTCRYLQYEILINWLKYEWFCRWQIKWRSTSIVMIENSKVDPVFIDYVAERVQWCLPWYSQNLAAVSIWMRSFWSWISVSSSYSINCRSFDAQLQLIKLAADWIYLISFFTQIASSMISSESKMSLT